MAWRPNGALTLMRIAPSHRYIRRRVIARQWSGAKYSVASGGKVMCAEAGCPCEGASSAATEPKLPTPEPP